MCIRDRFYAYGATEPQAGSDLGALSTTATPVQENGKVVGYKLNGRKQWISNGGVADRYTILANAPGGASWFLVDKGTEGFSCGKPEDKHGIRASNTAALFLENVYVPVDRLIGLVEGIGGDLAQAARVVGFVDRLGTFEEWGDRVAEIGGEDKWSDQPGAFAATEYDSWLAEIGLPGRGEGYSADGGKIAVVTIAGRVVRPVADPI